MMELGKRDGVTVIETDQCMMGLNMKNKEGEYESVMKPTRFLLKSLFTWCIVHRTKRVYVACKLIGGCAWGEYRY